MRLAALVALLLLPSSLAAQDRRLTERLDGQTAGAVQRVVDSAAAEGLPTEPLVQKALEGSTLGAPGDRITSAVMALHRQLASARQALGGDADEAELTAAAGALRAGLPASALRRLQSVRGGRPLVVPIAVLTDIVTEGLEPEEATRSVLALAREGRPDDDFVALRREVQTRRRGAGPDGPLDRPSLKPAADPPSDR
jgi:hypothetical protein